MTDSPDSGPGRPGELDPDARHGPGDIDPVTGHITTGHSWNGILELNTPMPRIAVIMLVLAFIASVILWILLPAWPTGKGYTAGLLGHDQNQIAAAGFARMEAKRSDWLSRFEDADFAAIMADDTLMANAMPDAERLFGDNCAACHGDDATGGPGFPSLVSGNWLWDGSPEGIAHTISVGINSEDPDTRYSEMLAYGAQGMLNHADLNAVADYVVALPSGTADPASPGAEIFATTCAACHGEGGEGGLGLGAPSLADDTVIYGQDRAAVWRTIWGGRHGVMPNWNDRLTPTQINLLATYVAHLAADDGAGADGAE